MGKIFKFGMIALFLIVASIFFIPSVFGVAADRIHYYDFENSSSVIFLVDNDDRVNGSLSGSFGFGIDFPLFIISGNGSETSGTWDEVGDLVNVSKITMASDGTSPFAISVWIKPNATVSLDTIYYGEEAASDNVWLRISTGIPDTIQFNIRDAGGITRTTTHDRTSTNWIHIVAEFNGTANNLYINGTRVDTFAMTDYSISALEFIGSFNLAGLFGFNGSMDEMKLFNSSLNLTEVSNLYNFGNIEGEEAAAPDNSIDIFDLSPANGTEINITLLPVNASVNATGLFNATLFVDDVFNTTQLNLPSGTNVFVNFNISFDDAEERELTFRIDVLNGFNATGNFTANATSATHTVIINNQAPIITLNTPSSEESIDDTSVTFNWSVADGFVINSTLHVFNETGLEIFSNTSTSANTIQSVSLDNGTYFWNITAADNLFTSASATRNFTINFTGTPSIITGNESGILVVGSCPDNLTNLGMIWLLIGIAMLFIFGGIFFKLGFMGMFGATLLLVSSWYVVGCAAVLASVLALISIYLIIWFVIKFGSGFDDSMKPFAGNFG